MTPALMICDRQNCPLQAVANVKLTREEGVVMVWSGLRGAIGLLMAVLLDQETSITDLEGSQVLFHISGFATLTLLINGTFAPVVLRKLGMMVTVEEKEKMLDEVRNAVVQRSKSQMQEVMNEAPAPESVIQGVDKGGARDMAEEDGAFVDGGTWEERSRSWLESWVFGFRER
ncbi:NHX7 [Symbiodinium pilosum]|uniref:NHX7 protein n=1 Tax=Symbiodinium pilosum TaxID=2952 RepID=A0A812Y2H5_SYMPI|nr:NHX7 [Symbiodinium pilosum]